MWSLITLAASAGYVIVSFRHGLDDADNLVIAVMAGVVALVASAYSIVNPTVHHRVSKILAGCGAIVATLCAGWFLYYSWTERARLHDLGILVVVLSFSALASLAATLAWITFCRCRWSKP